MAERARDLVRQRCEMREVQIVRGSVSADHVHMLVSAPPRLAPAKPVQYVKGRSSRRPKDEFPHLKKSCWGRHLWARGCFCATVEAVNEDTVRECIKSRKRDEEVEAFRVIAPESP